MSAGPIDPRSAMARAGQALKYWTDRQAVLSNNLANVNTAGFKGDDVFARLLDEATLTAEQTTDHRAGSLTVTGRELDIALETPGFFVVDTPQGERLTRNGGLTVLDGVLTDMNGNAILGSRGPIEVLQEQFEGRVEIATDGTVRVDDVVVDTLRVVSPTDPGAMEKEAGSLFNPGGAFPQELAPEEIRIVQGSLEESNVNSVEAMVDLLEVQRSYRSVERTIRVMDEVMATVTTRLGRIS